jgi:hypothetical protein
MKASASLVRPAVLGRGLLAEGIDEVGIDQLVQRSDLGRAAAGHLTTDAPRLQENDLAARLLQQQCGGQANDAAADDHDISEYLGPD